MAIHPIELVLRTGGVERMHTDDDVLVKQRIDSHSWGVAIIVWDILRAETSQQVLMAALVHDCPEYLTGDMRAPAKRMYPILNSTLKDIEEEWHREHGTGFELTPSEDQVLNAADKIEFVRWMHRERARGNRLAVAAFNKGWEYSSLAVERIEREYLRKRAKRILGSYVS